MLTRQWQHHNVTYHKQYPIISSKRPMKPHPAKENALWIAKNYKTHYENGLQFVIHGLKRIYVPSIRTSYVKKEVWLTKTFSSLVTQPSPRVTKLSLAGQFI